MLDEAVTIDAQHKESAVEPDQKDDPTIVCEWAKNSVRSGKFLKLSISVAMLGAVVGILAFNYDLAEILHDLHLLSPWTVAVIFAALLVNVLVATLRFKTIAADIGHSISFRSATATVSTSTLAGAMFFQIAGQLIARGASMARAGIPFADVVVITVYERIVSAALSGLLALAGAYYIFGSVYLDKDFGGAELIRISCGLIAATMFGALFGYGRLAVRSIAPLLTRHFTQRSLRVFGLTFLVQLPVMIAYVTTSKALSPDATVPSLIAASTVVMFAASVPISLAGWGVREMSAIAALGAIGVTGHAAFAAAVLVGIGSLLVTGLVAMLSVPGAIDTKQHRARPTPRSIDYSQALSWFLPLAAATLVLFQIYVPIGSGVLNVNLADPLVLLGGAFFVLRAVKQHEMPKWRARYVNAAVAIATLALAVSLLIGGLRVGWTTWASVNRFLGWFVLLSYGATGALAVMEGGKDALRIVLLTFAGATAAVAGIDVGLVLLREAGFQFAQELLNPIETFTQYYDAPFQMKGFSQNHNFFAFQVNAAACVTIVFARGNFARIVLLALFFAAIWYSASRSGWIALAFVVGTGLILGSTTIREVLTAAICAASVILTAAALYGLSHAVAPGEAQTGLIVPTIVPSGLSTDERMVTIRGGLKLFADHPLFGAGLGAFRSQTILSTSGVPLVIHSTALWLLAELEIIGFLTFAIPAIYIFVTEWRRVRKSNDLVSAVIVLSFVAFAVMSGPADMLYQRTFWLVVGTALAVPASIARGQSARQSDPPACAIAA